ncbi:MAG: YhgE/Pip family protein [Tuberibacillus sp.]
MFQVFMSEVRSFFSEKRHYIFISAILLVPIIYAGMFIWSFWSPYDHTDHLPVAVINNDTGATLAGEKVNLGDDLVKELKKNKSFEWHFVDAEEAKKGLDENRYYMTMTIPSSFSKNTTTVMEMRPERPTLYYHLNSGYNYISSMITDSGAQKIKNKLASEITKTYTENLFNKIDDLTDGLKKAADGAGDLNDGVKKELDGLYAIKANLEKLGDAGIKLQDGAKALAAGAGDLKDGIRQVQDGTDALYQKTKANTSSINDLAAGAKTLADKTAELNKGLAGMASGNRQMIDQLNSAALAQGLDQLSKGLDAEYQGLQALNEKVEPLSHIDTQMDQLNQWMSGAAALFSKIDAYNGTLTDDQKAQFAEIKKLSDQLQSQLVGMNETASTLDELKQLPAAIQKLTDGQKDLMNGFNDLNTQLQKLAAGLTALQQNIQQLPNATAQLAGGAQKVSDGTGALNKQWSALVSGIGQVNDGEQKLISGSLSLQQNLQTLEQSLAQMNEGSGQLTDGAGQLADGMKDIQKGSGQLSNKLNDAYGQSKDNHLASDNEKMFANPVKAKKSAGTVNKYGQGFTPYFLSLGLFVGALLLTVIYNIRDPYRKPRNGFAWALGKYIFLMLVGLIQALIADVIIMALIGVHVDQPLLFIAFSVLTSWTFMAIIQFFVSSMRDPGRFLVIIILVLQLTTTGGTYPIELLPPVLYDLHRFLPMNYSIAGFRNLVAGGQTDLLAHNSLMLLIFLVITLICTVTYLAFAFKKEFKNNMEASEERSA